jgi:hypothetical protein
VAFDATKQKVSNRGVPPDSFLDENGRLGQDSAGRGASGGRRCGLMIRFPELYYRNTDTLDLSHDQSLGSNQPPAEQGARGQSIPPA